jgi:guanylate kinase
MTAARGKLFVISAPSGAGKTSLVKALLERDPELRFSISYTTRKPRSTEVHSKDYFFVEPDEFRRMIAAGEFLEHAQVFDNFYGTSRSQVEELLAAGRNVILEIDWQGAHQINIQMPERVSIFVLPPSRIALEQRLRGRGTDSDAVIARRLRDSLGDMGHWPEFDYVIVNDDFERAVTQLRRIVAGQGADLTSDRPEVRQLVDSLQ